MFLLKKSGQFEGKIQLAHVPEEDGQADRVGRQAETGGRQGLVAWQGQAEGLVAGRVWWRAW